MKLINYIFILLLPLLFVGCIDDEVNSDPKYTYEYEGLQLYASKQSSSSYRLDQVNDSYLSSLPESEQIIIADKILSSMFFGLSNEELKVKLQNKDFISTLQKQFSENINDLDAIELEMSNEEKFDLDRNGYREINEVFIKFYLMDEIDKTYLEYWSAYILAQNIMFSPAYELESSHMPNVMRVYQRLLTSMRNEETIGYSTFLHMSSSDNWRRFRSPEDNGREMLEIFTLSFDDALIPLAGKALKNWKLDRDNDTLVVGLDENREELNLFNTTVQNGYDFYRELAKSDDFIPTVSSRLVDYFFPTYDSVNKQQIVDSIVQSNPKRWEDILVQIIFSKEYLLNSDRIKKVEELFFPLAKKLEYRHYVRFFGDFVNNISDMNQSAMKYKLGKSVAVPLDTQSFSNYHKFIREKVLLASLSENDEENYNYRYGVKSWVFFSDEIFSDISFTGREEFVERLVNHIFLNTIAREADIDEMSLFKEFLLNEEGDFEQNFYLHYLNERIRAGRIIFEYISRIDELYQYKRIR